MAKPNMSIQIDKKFEIYPSSVVAIEEKDTWTGNGRKGDLGCGEAFL